jgi:protein required for attachment to host cells
VTWIVIADGSRARIVAQRHESPGFDVVAEMQSPEAHVPSHLLTSERPGRTHESGNSSRHAIEPRHDPHQERLTAFVRSVADYLNGHAAGPAVDDIILFAPPHALGQLREMLNEGIIHKIRAEAPKDLTKLPISELPAHLKALR